MQKLRIFIAILLITAALALPASAAGSPGGVIDAFAEEHGLTEDNFVCGWQDIATGETYYLGADEFFVAGSMYKLPLCMAITDQIAAGETDPDGFVEGYRIADAMRLAIVYSDNDAAQALRQAVSADRDTYRERLAAYSGYEMSELPEEYYTDNRISPRFMINTLRWLYDHSGDYEQVIDYMLEAHPGHYFKLAETADAPVAHKYGYFEGCLSDCAIVYSERPFLLVAMTRGVPNAEEVLGDLCAEMIAWSESAPDLSGAAAVLPAALGAAGLIGLFAIFPRSALAILAAAAQLVSAAPVSVPESAAREWTLSFAGDCTIGTLHEWQGTQARNNMLYVMGGDCAYPFSGVSEVFENDDFTMVNLEGTFTGETDRRGKEFSFRAPVEYAAVLPAGGVEAVTLANNHTRDYREAGLADTVAALDGQGVLHADEGEPLIAELKGGLRLGVAAFNCVERDGEFAVGDVDGYMERLSADYVKLDEAGCGVKIAFIHWGWEYRSEPEGWMTELAHRLVDLGFDAVIGSHAHILQPMEYCGGAPVFYSLGNFCYGGHSSPEDYDTAIVQLTVTGGGDGFAVTGVDVLPCSVSSSAGYNDFRPRLYTGEGDIARVLEKLRFTPAA